MSPSARLILSAAVVGGLCGAAGAALYIAWRASHRPAGERASVVLGQLEQVADRIEDSLRKAPETS
jgi:hypothetical protein